jgi:hypothetical protein
MGEPEPLFAPMAMVGVFDDLDIDIEAMSMERVSDMVLQKRALEMLQIVGQLAQSVIAAPHVKWKDVMSVVGDAMNIPNLGDLIDLSKVMQMQQGASQAPQGGDSPQQALSQILSRSKGR